MIKVGITGGIGSGKTYICKKFEKLGVKIYYADERAKFLTNNNKYIKSKLISNFGNNIYINNKIDKVKLAQIIFNNSKKLNIINSIIHPVVNNDFNEWCNKYKSEKFILKEAAILFESGSYKNLDKIITVISPIDLRIKRIKERDKLNEQDIIKKINTQISDIEKIKKSDFVIYNDKINNLDKQINFIYKTLKKH